MPGVAVALGFLCSVVANQEAFEVASVKPADPRDGHVQWLTYAGGRIAITNFTLAMLIEAAYGMSPYRVIGGPPWTDREYYSIVAKAPAGSTAAAFIPATPKALPPPEHLAMIRTLLNDRFELKVHRETRQLPVYLLVIAKGGPKLRPAHESSVETRWDSGN